MMDKKLSDTLAIALAAKILESDPSEIIKFTDTGNPADSVADFIQQLSARLEKDVSDLSSNNVTFLIKQG